MSAPRRARALAGVALLLVLAVDAGAARGDPSLRGLGCESCHLADRPAPFLFESYAAFQRSPAPAATACAQCHVNNALAVAGPRAAGWLPLASDTIERVRRFHAYVQAPALAVAVPRPGAPPLPRFTDCGLAAFLASPVPRRWSADQSMFPLEPSRLRAVLRALRSRLEPCATAAAAPAAIARGRDLFASRACIACHGAAGAGPRLRLGIPLLGRQFFGARVRRGTATGEPVVWQRGWRAVAGQIVADRAGPVAMPAQPDLSDADLDALYAYVSVDSSDRIAAAPALPRAAVPVADAIRLPLFREVQRRVFDTSCRHCHAPAPADQRLIEGVFGRVAGQPPLALPTSRLPTLAHSRALRDVLAPGPGCTDSRLVARLRARHDEWTGQRRPGAARGMPLTLPPLPMDAIRLVETWTAAGCPSDAGDLCARCGTP